MPRSFPIALKLTGRECLVVGSGDEASERARALAAAGARVSCVSPAPSAELTALAGAGAILLAERPFREQDLDGKWLAVLTDRDAELAARIAAAAEPRQIFFCATDQPEHNSFAHVALARAGLVTLAISTEGEAPALGRKLREELEQLLDRAGMAAFAEELAELRRRTPSADRRDVLGRAVASVAFQGRLRLRPEP